jgi:hypothetical protein
MVRRILAVLAIVGCLLPASSSAQRAAVRPWAQGVPEAEQTEALKLFREGNVFFEKSQYSQALERYRAAVQHWDHPSIRFNMAVSLINLDQPLEARESLEKSLLYGAAALDTPDLYAQGLTYRKLLEGRLAVLVVRCNEPGARVSLDGKEVLQAPGETRHVLLPGEHQIVASKDGFLTSTRPLTLISGREHREDIQLVTVASATRYERRWAVWKPWVVLSAGAAIALMGLALELSSSADYNKYGSDIAQLCPMGCQLSTLSGSVTDVQSRALGENVAAITSFAVGGAVMASGIVLAILNREHPVIHREESSPRHVRVVPAVGVRSAGVSALVSF